jgi:2-hydroxyacyl-CoA lyase 1
MSRKTGAHFIAQAIKDLGVEVSFGLVGIPIVDIAEECINLGIRFIALRNEQSASYAATAYGYITGKPAICLLVGGPGILHGIAGIGNASANGWPCLFLGGNSERDLNTKGAFQEMDAVSLLSPHTKTAILPHSNDADVIVSAIYHAYRIAWYGRPGPTFIDLPADLIMNPQLPTARVSPRAMIKPPPKPSPDHQTAMTAAGMLQNAKAPLVIIGKGAALSRSEDAINTLINTHNIPFLPTPMGKGVVPDTHPLNTTSARSAALKSADVILLLGARLNWILHYGASPKYHPNVQIIQIDISPSDLGIANSAGNPSLSILADIGTAVSAISACLSGWKYLSTPTLKESAPGSYCSLLSAAAGKNEAKAQALALTPQRPGTHLTYQRAYHIIRGIFDELSPPEDGEIVYIAEGANTMDISRASFQQSLPRQRLDAGTYATMGVGMAYAIAAHAAYNTPGQKRRKKIVALEGDSAIGFSGMEIETMQRNGMDILIVVMNNSGIYHGDVEDKAAWERKRQQNLSSDLGPKKGLRSTSLWYDTRYEKMAEMVGGKGYFVRTEQELARATREAFLESENVSLINVIIESGVGKSISLAWEQQKEMYSLEKEKEAGRAAKL